MCPFRIWIWDADYIQCKIFEKIDFEKSPKKLTILDDFWHFEKSQKSFFNLEKRLYSWFWASLNVKSSKKFDFEKGPTFCQKEVKIYK